MQSGTVRALAPPQSGKTAVVRPAKPSLWVWVPFVWLFIVSTRALSTWLNLAGHTSLTADPEMSGSPVDSVLLATLMALGLIVLFTRAERAKRLLFRNKWLLVLFAYMAISTAWSNFPDVTIRRWIRSAGTLVMVLVIHTEDNPLGALKALLRRVYLLYIPASIAAIKYFRNIGVTFDWSGSEEMWIGLSVHKNNLGQVAMCSGLFSTWQILQNWSRKKLTLDLLVLLLTFWLLRGSKNSHSSTAILGFLVSTMILIALQFTRKRAARAKRIVLTSVVVAALLIPCVYVSFQAFGTTPVDLVLQATGRDLTLTDRTLLWADILHNAAKSPIVGVGFGAFWVGNHGYQLYVMENWDKKTPEWRPNEGHDGYIDVFIDLGAIGVVLVLIVI
ncbi:MAG TPA: O-antigen ligase family protein, partial [Terriglobales bacterium]|nr:O-antigen ligase family protein [Terriglobales bacterium]